MRQQTRLTLSPVLALVLLLALAGLAPAAAETVPADHLDRRATGDELAKSAAPASATDQAFAETADTACFDWVCYVNGDCQFDASCSSASPSIWKYHWTWGDGTSTGFVSSPLQSHAYASSVYTTTVRLQVWTFSNMTSVSCKVTVREGAGNPLPFISGRCTSN